MCIEAISTGSCHSGVLTPAIIRAVTFIKPQLTRYFIPTTVWLLIEELTQQHARALL